jgi:bacterioferritin (cytochrome b1)
LAVRLNSDLQREVEHMFFYVQAAVHVTGLHRHELREFFLEESREELGHVQEFADMVSYVNGLSPVFKYDSTPLNLATHLQTEPKYTPLCQMTPQELLAEIVRMEEEVAATYAKRMIETEGSEDPYIAAAHVFYEDQIKNSQTTAWEVKKWLSKMPETPKSEG